MLFLLETLQFHQLREKSEEQSKTGLLSSPTCFESNSLKWTFLEGTYLRPNMKKYINLEEVFLSSLVQCLLFQAQLQITAVLKIQQMLWLNSSENRSLSRKPQKNLLTTNQQHHFVIKILVCYPDNILHVDTRENYDKRPWASRAPSCWFIFSAENIYSWYNKIRGRKTEIWFFKII